MAGNLDFVKNKACVVLCEMPNGLVYERIYYGLSVDDFHRLFPSSTQARSLPTKHEKSRGRGPSYGWEEPKKPVAFFTGKL